MSKKPPNAGTIFVEDSWPPLRIWGYVMLPVVVLAIPTIFIGGDFRAVAVAAIGLWLFIMGFVLLVGARRHWWVTTRSLGVSRMPLIVRAYWGLPSVGRRVPLSEIQRVESMEGKLRDIRREAFGDTPTQKEAGGGSVDKFWCKGAVIVRLIQPDEYGDTALLSTERPQEASSVLIQAIRDKQQRPGTAT